MAPNRWTTFVKEWAADNNVSYMRALTDPELKKEYNKFYTPAAKKELRNEANRRRRKEKTESGMMEEEDINRAVRRRTLPDTTQLEKDIAKLRKKAPEMLFEAAKSKSKKITLPDFGEILSAAELKAQIAPKKTKSKGSGVRGGALIGRQPYVEGGCMMCGGKLTGKKIVKGLKKAGKATASALLHYGLPATLGVAGEMMGGPAGAAFGSMAGDMIADKVGEKTGYGLKQKIGFGIKKGRPSINNIDYLSTSRGSFV